MKHNFQERKTPELFKFNQPGDLVAGTLVSVKTVSIEGKPTIQYMVLTEDGDLKKFLGTYNIVEKLLAGDVGKFIQVAFMGTDESVKRNGNAMRIFEVLIEEPETAEATNSATVPASGQRTEQEVKDDPWHGTQPKQPEEGQSAQHIPDDDIPF